jgi:hypothetical protein
MNRWLQWNILAFWLVLGLVFCMPLVGVAQTDSFLIQDTLKVYTVSGNVSFKGVNTTKRSSRYQEHPLVGATIVLWQGKLYKKESETGVTGGYTDSNGAFTITARIDPSKMYWLSINAFCYKPTGRKILFSQKVKDMYVKVVLKEQTTGG